MGEFKSFTLGKDPYPDWFKELDKAKKVTYETDSEGTLLRVRIQNPTGAVRVDAGEMIVNTGESIIKLTQAIIDKYGR